ncbi:hypothetical protein [Flavobacterium tegetincola]|uniref:hypothetical protein n=1 Tax=Flavobacterium tegetincola TaxID=150172 RepID=UPI0012F8523A|nr:hypothetical protein [Flavobacterium tegetincola]
MKNLFFGLIAVIAFSVSGFAGNNVEKFPFQSSEILSTNVETVIFGYTNVVYTTTFSVNPLDLALCDVTVTVSVGVSQTYASLTVTIKDVDCKTVVAEAKKMKKQLEDALAS